MANWKILDRGEVPIETASISYTCPACDRDADLPVMGLALAQMSGGGLVFDRGPYALPILIQCPHCRRRFESSQSLETEEEIPN